jgi:Domain of unknown function (DUF4276)
MIHRINILCEGPTEEQFVNRVLSPHFLSKNIVVTPRRLDGNCGYDRVEAECIRWLNQEKNACVTTMIDLYGRKGTYPGELPKSNGSAWVTQIEDAMHNKVVNNSKAHNKQFIPYLQLHELEALLFSDPATLTKWLSLDHAIPPMAFEKILEGFETPEHINDHPETAPSKRIKQIVPGYSKVADGPLILQEIGLSKIRAACSHFDAWITKLETAFT